MRPSEFTNKRHCENLIADRVEMYVNLPPQPRHLAVTGGRHHVDQQGRGEALLLNVPGLQGITATQRENIKDGVPCDAVHSRPGVILLLWLAGSAATVVCAAAWMLGGAAW